MSENIKSMEKMANAAAQKFIGMVAWPTIILAVFVIGSYVLTLSALVSGKISLLSAYILASLLTYAVYTVLHDAVHGSINGKNNSLRFLNDGLGYLAGQIMFVSFKAHRHEHFAHHIHTNKADKDPDLYVKNDSILSLLYGTIVVLPLQYQFYFNTKWKTVSSKDKAIVLSELIVMVAWRLVFVFYGLWQEAVVLFVFATLTGVFMLVILFVWLVHRSNDQTQRYKNTSTYIMPQFINTPVTWLWLQQNYHSIHHLFPSVPFYHYKDLFELIEDTMVANDAPIIRIGKKTGDSSN